MKPILFGTEGWRAVLADDYTFDRVRAAARAAGRWFQRQPRKAPVAVAGLPLPQAVPGGE